MLLCATLSSTILLAGCGGEETPKLVVQEQPAPVAGGADAPAADAPRPPSANAAGDPDDPFVVPPEDQPKETYPFYMDMTGLRPPEVVLHVRCDESIAAGKHVFADGEKAPWNNYSKGGVEIVYQAFDDTGAPCVYPFAPWTPTRGGGANEWPDGSQFIYRSAVPGHRVTFRSDSQWAKMHFKPYKFDDRRFHFEISDIELDFPGAVNAMGALHLEAVPTQEALLTAVVRRSRLTGGRNALFAPSGQTMVYVEDSQIGINVGDSVEQEHAIYLNGLLSAHFVDSTVFGQKAKGIYGGHQLKNKSYLTILENVTLDNSGGTADPSNRPLYDGSAWGFTWASGLELVRQQTSGATREMLIDLRRDHYQTYSGAQVPWDNAAGWEMPSDDCSGDVAGEVYLHVFHDTKVDSFQAEEDVLRIDGAFDMVTGAYRGEGTSYEDVMANPRRNRAMSLSFNAEGDFERFSSPVGYWYQKPKHPKVYACDDPQLAPSVANLANDRDAFISHALDLWSQANDFDPR